MSTYTATIRWSRKGGDFAKGQYSRAHEWAFDGGAIVPASASPDNVPPGTADEAGVDPEEAFIAALSSCHMLFFLDFARRAGFVVDSYVDEADGALEKARRRQDRHDPRNPPPADHLGRQCTGRGGHRRPPPPRARSLLHREQRDDQGAGRDLIPPRT